MSSFGPVIKRRLGVADNYRLGTLFEQVLLEDGEDIVYEVSSQYTATNGSSIVLTTAAEEGDVIFIVPQAA